MSGRLAVPPGAIKPNKLTLCGIAGGVGTTVAATLLDAVEVDDVADADLVVAINDYRCARALLEANLRANTRVLVWVDPERALRFEDFTGLLPNLQLHQARWDPRIARADDAGLLEATRDRWLQRDSTLVNMQHLAPTGATDDEEDTQR